MVHSARILSMGMIVMKIRPKIEFSTKVRFLESIGLFTRRFNHETLQFEQSWYLRLKSKLILFVELLIALKIGASPLFEREDPVQLFIGNVIPEHIVSL